MDFKERFDNFCLFPKLSDGSLSFSFRNLSFKRPGAMFFCASKYP